MQLFYSRSVSNDIILLDEKESGHCIRVLRMKAGDKIMVTDGRGNMFSGVIIKTDPSKCEIRVLNVIRDFDKRQYRLHIAISPLKNPERFEWFIEKCVEIGIDEITPIICRNSEKTSIKNDRISNIILSAMKQSVKTIKTELNQLCTINEFIKTESSGKKLIAHCNETFKRVKIADTYNRGDDVIIMIGPEGDFSTEEIASALVSGFTGVHLGKSRLRSETAGIAACHSFYLLNQ